MGAIKRYECPSCKKNWEVLEGCGMLHSELTEVLKVFSEDIQNKINADVRGEQFPRFVFNYKAALCKECGSITRVPVIETLTKGNTYIGRCDICGGKEDISMEIVCPKCGGDIETTAAGNWD